MSQLNLIDTNVLIAANSRNTHADLECQLACIEKLEEIVSNEMIVLDNMGLILEEYSRHCHYRGEPGVEDLFFKHSFDNQSVEGKCFLASITPDPIRENNFIEFPQHPDLVNFDLSDRKFVAASISSPEDTPIYNATDSDWENARIALEECNINVMQLCPQHINKQHGT